MTVRRAMRFLLCAAALAACPTPAPAAESAVVFIYHRFGEDGYPSTSVTVDQFKAHLEALKAGGYAVLPLADIVARIQGGQGVPDRTVGISIDDAYSSAYTVAFPLLKAAGFPFTVFVASDEVGGRDRMSWDQLREIKAAGNAIGGHAAAHPHLPLLTVDQSRAELERAKRAYEKELGEAPRLLAWPYGEYALALKPLAQALGYTAAFGQHSGVIGPSADFFFLPRFAMNENYGDPARFKLAARSLALPVRDVTPADPLLTPQTNPPAFGFTVGDGVGALDSLRCYADGQKVDLQKLGERRIEVRVERPYPPGRVRINCTLPADGGRWRWFGTQFYVRRN
jgi:peptidoglycan/xylan/chitin deacetylase (PgdA/CDA1 family)